MGQRMDFAAIILNDTCDGKQGMAYADHQIAGLLIIDEYDLQQFGGTRENNTGLFLNRLIQRGVVQILIE